MTRMVETRQVAQWLWTGEALLIDVREADEFKAEHIASAMSVPLGSVAESMDDLPVRSGVKLVFQCRTGARGKQACDIAANAPGRDVYNLDGGIEAWKASGLAVVRSGAAAPSLFRQVQIGVGCFVLLAVLAGFAGWTPGFALAGFFGAMLIFAGLTGWCGLALLLQRMPWNRPGPATA